MTKPFLHISLLYSQYLPWVKTNILKMQSLYTGIQVIIADDKYRIYMLDLPQQQTCQHLENKIGILWLM